MLFNAPAPRFPRPSDDGNFLDASIHNQGEHERQVGQLHRQVERLRDALAERDEFIAVLQERLETALGVGA